MISDAAREVFEIAHPLTRSEVRRGLVVASAGVIARIQSRSCEHVVVMLATHSKVSQTIRHRVMLARIFTAEDGRTRCVPPYVIHSDDLDGLFEALSQARDLIAREIRESEGV